MLTKVNLVALSAVFIALITAYLISIDIQLGLLFPMFFIIVIPLLYVLYNKPFIGIILTLIISFFILGILRFVDLPLGILMDAIIVLLFLITLIHAITEKNNLSVTNIISIFVIIWITYNFLQLLNPLAASRAVWIYAIRPIAITMLFYFVSLRYINTYENVKIFSYVFILLSSLLAFYGIFQEYNGLLPAEEAWVRSDPGRLALFFNWWRFRKFSFFADPMTFGVTCAYSGVFALILALGSSIQAWKRIVLGILSALMFFSMVFSGTRTAYVMPVAGFGFYVLLNLNWKVITASTLIFALFFGIIISPIKSIGPLDENNLNRIRSAFFPTDDPSFNVRLKNQAMIQPYIHTHPIGGGIGSTGQLAVKFTPNTMLSQFQVDSGFVKIGVEQGIVGLLIYCLLLFFIFKIGLEAHKKLNDSKDKNILAAILCTLFSILVANYAQEVITMYPTNIIFYGFMGIIIYYYNFTKFKENDNYEKVL